MREYCLTPTNVVKPPKHTQIPIRCENCKKFPICSIREDYIKTAILMQNILGDPQEDLELDIYGCDCGCRIDGFWGYDFEKPSDYFPEEISLTTETSDNVLTGALKEAKYRNKDYISLLYEVQKFLIQIDVMWNMDDEVYDVLDGFEVFYKGKLIVSKDSQTNITEKLPDWRESIIKLEEENKKLDIINTTHFSARLDCEFYEQDKNLKCGEGWNRMIAECPDYCCHLATYHIEPQKILPNGDNKVDFYPYPYIPRFCPPPPPKPLYRRDEVSFE